jgi:polysaccharide export outer membrane protein
MAVLTAGGCVHTSAPVVQSQQQAVPSDLDSFAYARQAAPRAHAAHASPQREAQAHARAYAEAQARIQAQAQAQAQPQAKAQPKAQSKAQAKAQAQAEARAQAEAEARVQAEARAQAEAQARAQSQSPAQADAPARAQQTQEFADGRNVTPAAMQARAQGTVAHAPAEHRYVLDTGDKLRIVVFGQDGLSNSYFVDAAGLVTMPLIGAVNARGLTTQQLARDVSAKLRNGFIREPHVAIEVETYRPFFILGEVTQPGQYPYVPNMTIETAVAIAGGFTPRAYRWEVQIDRPAAGGVVRERGSVPLLTRLQPGDTIIIKERWF